ncbi:conserved phage C-terminal domain-containing protein [Lactobacillus gasseri]|uniref:Conserved phage C-terminal domain-containing protein n=1 Tax=Lactobacillus gasseri TaxID=1596 RepID=A0A8A4UYK4_LACGS|nr:conserved phage C-terminal domain-containing protein [Lactobacillus gasseri]QTD66324.1 conserved phage C-terminal domain-containing protein [Lactobacillus gasseri]
MAEEFTGSRLFLNIPASVAHDERIKSDKTILLYGEVLSMINVTGSFYMSNKALAKRLRCTPQTVIRCVRELEKLNYIKTTIVKDKKTGAVKGRKIELRPVPINTDARGDGNTDDSTPITSVLKTPYHSCYEGGNTDDTQIEQYNKTINRTEEDIDKLSSSENVDPELKQKSQKIPYEKIIDYLNRKTNSHYRPTSKATRRLIKARYNEGFTDIDFKTVIDKKCAEWLQDSNMVQYLRPETLFGTKFEAYLNQPDTGPIPRRNFGSKPVRKATDWEQVQQRIQQQQSQTVPKLTKEERNAIFREYGR